VYTTAAAELLLVADELLLAADELCDELLQLLTAIVSISEAARAISTDWRLACIREVCIVIPYRQPFLTVQS